MFFNLFGNNNSPVPVHSYKCPWCGKLFENKQEADDHVFCCKLNGVKIINLTYGYSLTFDWFKPFTFHLSHCSSTEEIEFGKVFVETSMMDRSASTPNIIRHFWAYARNEREARTMEMELLKQADEELNKIREVLKKIGNHEVKKTDWND